MMRCVRVPSHLINCNNFQLTLQTLHISMSVVVTYFEYSVVELHGVYSELNEIISSYKLKDA